VKEFDCSYHNALRRQRHADRDRSRVTLQARSVGRSPVIKFKEDDEIGCPNWPTVRMHACRPAGDRRRLCDPMPKPARRMTATAIPDGTVLGDCALELTTDGLQGFMVSGKPIDEGAAIVRAVKESEAHC
jgi:hypothetical protein